MRFNCFKLHNAVILVLLLALSGWAWSNMLFMHQAMNMETMADSWMPPLPNHMWSSVDFNHTFTMWLVMMIAMMIPSVIPMVFGFMRAFRLRSYKPNLYLGAMAFVSGYFMVWTIYCSVMTVLQWQLQALALLSPMMESRNSTLSSTLFIVAGLYQLTAYKSVCLAHCRNAFYLNQDCHNKSIVMGLHHGMYCVGSCWALMLLMFAGGVMNLLWMGSITLMVTLEKTLPLNPIWLKYCSGLALLIWGCYLLIPLDLTLGIA